MDLDARLRAFAAFARRRSFSGAAGELFISQPAVSKHVADLEQALGVQLVVRQPRGGSLTPAGQFLAEYVLRAEALLAQAARGMVAFRNPEQGVLSLAASGTPGTYLLPRLLAAFRENHPGVEILTHFGTSSQVVEVVRSYQAELGLVGGLVAAREIETEPVVDDEVVLVGPPSLGSRPLQPRELQEYTWISREEGWATRAAVEAEWLDLGIVPPKRLELPSWEAVKVAVAHGMGIAACSRLAIQVELKAGTVAVLDVPRWRLWRTISVIYMADTPLTWPTERFLETLRGYSEGGRTDALPQQRTELRSGTA